MFVMRWKTLCKQGSNAFTAKKGGEEQSGFDAILSRTFRCRRWTAMALAIAQAARTTPPGMVSGRNRYVLRIYEPFATRTRWHTTIHVLMPHKGAIAAAHPSPVTAMNRATVVHTPMASWRAVPSPEAVIRTQTAADFTGSDGLPRVVYGLSKLARKKKM
jgi:hypothetical protein